MNAEQMIKNASISLHEFDIAINKLNRIQKMENIIKQIRKIKGVMAVKKSGENMAVVVFEPKRRPIAVECTTEDQFNFMKEYLNMDITTDFSSWLGNPCFELNRNESEFYGCFGSESGCFENFKILSFDTYLSDYNSFKRWNEFIKPKSLSPDELVDGKIYVDEDNGRVVRFNKIKNGCAISLYSQKCIEGTYYNSLNGYGKNYHYRGLFRHATPSEAQSLILAEIEHGYFHELRDAK